LWGCNPWMCASKKRQCQPEYCDSRSLIPPTDLDLSTMMEKPLLVNFPYQQYLRTREYRKNDESGKITHSPHGPKSPVPHTSDLSGPSHHPPYHPMVSPGYSLQHPAIPDPLSAYSRTLRDFESISSNMTFGGYGSPQQCISCC
jgi:hypothetical protein